MRNTARVILGATIATLIGTAIPATSALAADKFPTEKQCTDPKNPVANDPVTKGACVVVVRTKGNCMACHQIDGLPSGNVATHLKDIKVRYPGEEGKKNLHKQINDSRVANPKTVMPPFGAHAILSQDEIDNLVEFILTL